MSLQIVIYNPVIPNNTGNIIRTTACTGAKLHLVKPLGFSLDDTHLKRAGLDYHDLAHTQIHENYEDLLAHLTSHLNDGSQFSSTQPASSLSFAGDEKIENLVSCNIEMPKNDNSLLDDHTPKPHVSSTHWGNNSDNFSGRIFAFSAHGTKRHDTISYQDGDVLLFGTEPSGLPAHLLAHPSVNEVIRIPMLPGRRSLNLANAVAVALYEAWRQIGFSQADFTEEWRNN